MIGAVIAMESEAKILKDLMTITEEKTVHGKKIVIGSLDEKEIVMIVCGVGKVNAAMGAQHLIDVYSVDKVLNFGVAGGIRETTETTQVYAICGAVEYDFDLAGLNGTSIGVLNEFTERYLPLSPLPVALPERKLATGDRFNDDKDDYLLLRDDMQADIRDMEGAAIVHTCIHAGIPVYEVKAISDKAGNKSSFEQFRENLNIALENLKAYLPEIIAAL